MIPLVQPTVSFIKKWGQSLHICRAHHWHQDFQLEIPAGSAVKWHAERRGITQFGHGSPPVPPLSSRNCCCLVPASFSTLFSHTHALAKQHTHTHTYMLSQIICSNYYFWSAQKCASPFTKYTTWRLLHIHSSDSDSMILIQASLKMSWKSSFDSVDQA